MFTSKLFMSKVRDADGRGPKEMSVGVGGPAVVLLVIGAVLFFIGSYREVAWITRSENGHINGFKTEPHRLPEVNTSVALVGTEAGGRAQ